MLLSNVSRHELAAARDGVMPAAGDRWDTSALEVVPPRTASGSRGRLPAIVAGFESRSTSSGRSPVNAPVYRPVVEVRISVIDGADRMVYRDARDAKGWRQPLALGSAENDARRRNRGDHAVSTSEPRAVITTVAATAQGRTKLAGEVPSISTPYSAGKATVANRGAAGPARSAVDAKEPRRQPSGKSMGR